MLIGIVFYMVGKPVYLPLQWCTTSNDHVFVGWASQLNMCVAPKLPMLNSVLYSPVGIETCFELFHGLELSISNKEQTRHIGNFTLYSFNTPSGASVAGGRSIRSLAPPPHAGHHPGRTLLWDGLLFLYQESLQFSQCGCDGQLLTRTARPSWAHKCSVGLRSGLFSLLPHSGGSLGSVGGDCCHLGGWN